MQARYPELPARYYVRLAEILQRQGVDLPRLLKAARVRPGLLSRPDAMLRLDQVEALVAQAFVATGRTDLGLDLGHSLKLSSHSILGFGILSSPSVDYALRLAARFFRLITPTFRMRYRLDRAHLQIGFEPALPLSHAALAFHIEAVAASTHRALRELLRDHVPRYDLHLSTGRPAHAARYAEMAEARCHFASGSSPGLRLVLPAGIAMRPPAMAEPAALKMAEERCSALFRSAVAGGKVSDWVRMMLREASDGIPTLTELAHTLNLSARTLDRHLNREGVGFRTLALGARHDKARALLDGSTLSVTQVAHELGYSDAANFTRAFRRESGMAPSQWRQRRRRRGA